MTASSLRRLPGALIATGIGAPEPFEALLERLGGLPERFIAVEPSETPGGKLAQRYAGLDGVDLVDGFLADVNGNAELTCYNLPGLRSLCPPLAALKDYYPGLRVRGTVEVRTVLLEEAIADVEAVPAPVRLHLDLPGMESAVLNKLEETGHLARLELLSVRCAQRQAFEGAWDRKRLQSWLEERYFRIDHANEEDPEWPVMVLGADHEKRLRERNAQLEGELDRLQNDLGVALRMQDLAHNDLQELQCRYREVEAARSAQAALLEKLTPRLQQAAAQLREFISFEASPELHALDFGLTEDERPSELAQPKTSPAGSAQGSNTESPKREAIGKQRG